jgi:transposase
MGPQLYPTDLADRQYYFIRDLISTSRPDGHPRTLDMRMGINAIFYVIVGGIQRRMLPRKYPNCKSVYHYFRPSTASASNDETG